MDVFSWPLASGSRSPSQSPGLSPSWTQRAHSNLTPHLGRRNLGLVSESVQDCGNSGSKAQLWVVVCRVSWVVCWEWSVPVTEHTSALLCHCRGKMDVFTQPRKLRWSAVRPNPLGLITKEQRNEFSKGACALRAHCLAFFILMQWQKVIQHSLFWFPPFNAEVYMTWTRAFTIPHINVYCTI